MATTYTPEEKQSIEAKFRSENAEFSSKVGRTGFTNAVWARKGLTEAQLKRIKCSELDELEEIDATTTASFATTTTQFQNTTAKFQEEYYYWRSQGQAHIVAYRKAVDYYRKHLRHEVTVDWQDAVDATKCSDSANDVVERIQFNQIIRQVAADLTDRQFEMLCYILVQQDLDDQLDDQMRERVYAVTKEQRPQEVKEIAVCMGLKLSKINVCTPLTKLRDRVKEVFVKHNFVLGAYVRN